MPQTDTRVLSTKHTASDVTEKGQRERKPSNKHIWEEENKNIENISK